MEQCTWFVLDLIPVARVCTVIGATDFSASIHERDLPKKFSWARPLEIAAKKHKLTGGY